MPSYFSAELVAFEFTGHSELTAELREQLDNLRATAAQELSLTRSTALSTNSELLLEPRAREPRARDAGPRAWRDAAKLIEASESVTTMVCREPDHPSEYPRPRH